MTASKAGAADAGGLSILPLPDLIKVMRRAVGDEITFRRESRPYADSVIPLSDGRKVGQVGRSWKYLFRSPDISPKIADDAQGDLMIGASRYFATVLGLGPAGLVVAVDADLGPEIPQARLLIDLTRLLEALDRRLEQILANPSSFQSRLALKSFDPTAKPAQVPYGGPMEPPAGFALNQGQNKAFTRGLSSDLLFIWGPPGTGKTKVIGAITASCVRAGRRVLITSNTNAAVDQALDKVLEGLNDPPEGTAVRFGTPSVQASKAVEQVALSVLVKKRAGPLEARLADLQSRVAPIDQRLEVLRSCTEKADALASLEQQGNASRARLRSCEADEHSAKAGYAVADAEVAKFEGELAHIRASNVLRRLFLRKETTVREDLSKAEGKRYEAKRRIEETNNFLRDARSALLEIEHQLERELQEFAAISGGLDAGTIRRELARLVAESQQLHQEISVIQQRLAQLEKEILRNASAVSTTLTRTYASPLMEDERFDTVIVDEVSMAIPPALFAALCMGTSQAILVGDFLQLPPIAQSESKAAKEWLRRDIYQVSQIDSRGDKRVAALDTQYRMHPGIACVAANLYRLHDLGYKTGEGVAERLKAIVGRPPAAKVPLVFCDTAAADPWTGHDDNRSTYNFYHAAAALKLAKDALAGYGGEIPSDPPVAIIAPYRAQVKLLEGLVQAEGLEGKVAVGTVHRFQGQESDVVIFDITATTSLDHTMLGRTEEGTSAHKLVNVAVTRARGKLILVGHSEAVQGLSNSPYPILFDAYQFARNRSGLLDSTGFFPVLTHWSRDRRLDTLEFTPHVLAAIGRAQKSIWINSPFIDPEGLDLFVGPIVKAVQRGVAVRISHRPLEAVSPRHAGQVGRMLDGLASAGVEMTGPVSGRGGFVLLDGRILYTGLLSPLDSPDGPGTSHLIEFGADISDALRGVGAAQNGGATQSGSGRAENGDGSWNEEECRQSLKKFRWIIAQRQRVPFYSVLYNKTIDELVRLRPRTPEELRRIDEFARRWSVIGPFAEDILAMIGTG